MYHIIGKVDGHIEGKNKSKYLVFDSTDENKEVLKKYTELWDGIKNEIETINGGKKGEYGKDFMKIKFNTDDKLALNKPLKLHLLRFIKSTDRWPIDHWSKDPPTTFHLPTDPTIVINLVKTEDQILNMFCNLKSFKTFFIN